MAGKLLTCKTFSLYPFKIGHMVIAGYFASFCGTTITSVYIGHLLYVTRVLIMAANKSPINPMFMM